MKFTTREYFIVFMIITLCFFLINVVGTLRYTKIGDNPCVGNNYINDSSLIGSSGTLFTGDKFRSYKGKKPSFIKSNNKQRGHNTCKKWGVVTTIFKLSEPIMKVAKLADSDSSWCLVIVLDKNGKPYNDYDRFLTDRVIILDVEKQEEMSRNNKFIKKLPWNHFSRKNVGYYYAISQGAEAIFDFDDDNLLYNESSIDYLLNRLKFDVIEPIINGDAFNRDTFNRDAFNPYPLMNPNVSQTWPRGFPLDKIKESNRPIEIKIDEIEVKKIGIIQLLANNDPDVDAIYRLTNPIPFEFKSNGKAVLIPKNCITPFNAQATIWRKQAFFGLLLPITVHGRVSDIWRSFIIGRLLKDFNIDITFNSPLVVQNRNPHNYLKDFQAELPLYLQSGVFISFVKNWVSIGSYWYNKLDELVIELYERGFIEEDDVELHKLWIQALLDIGFDPLDDEEIHPQKVLKDDEIHPQTMINDCLFKPFCWKQLNWRDRDPDIKNLICAQKRSLKFYDFNIHDGVMMDHSNLIENSLSDISESINSTIRVKHEVFHWNYKKSHPASSRSIHTLKNSPIQTLPLQKFIDKKHSEKIWNLFHNNEHFSDVDALIFGFLPADFEFFTQFNKTIIIDAAHRINLFRCSINESMNTFQKIIDMSKSSNPRHIIGAHYLYDVEYIYHYTGISPILLPATQLDSINDKYIGNNGKIFINGHVRPKELIDTLTGTFEIIHSDDYFGYTYKTIADMKAIIYLPYSISNYKFIDHYAMGIPIFSPTPRFAVELKLYVDRTVSGSKYYCPDMGVDVNVSR